MVIKQENGIKEVELIVSGRVQSVGYRQYVAGIGRKLKLAGFEENGIKEVELIVSGRVQSVGYRQYVAGIGRKLKLAGFVKNLKDDTVQIRCKGVEKAINEFKEKIIVKNPDDAPLIDVEEIKEKRLARGQIKQKNFEEKYGKLTAEMSQGNTTGINYLNLFRKETKASFEHMNEKYDKISQAMFDVVKEIKEMNKSFEIRIEKTEKNIESLLEILTQKQS